MSNVDSLSNHGISPSFEPLSETSRQFPRTDLGRRLQEIRRRIVASGQPLLDWEEFDREMRERRGEPEEAG